MLTRDPKYVEKTLQGDLLKTTKETYIYIPKRFQDIKLVNIDTTVKTIGVFIIVVDGKYAVSRITGTMTLTPSSIANENLNGEEYLKLTFLEGSNILSTVDVMKLTPNLFGTLQDFIIAGRIPFFINEDDLEIILSNGGYYITDKVAHLAKTIELMVSVVARSKLNPNMFFRWNTKGEVVFKGLSDMKYGYNNPISKTTHNYFKKGLISSLNMENKTPTKLDGVLNDLGEE